MIDELRRETEQTKILEIEELGREDRYKFFKQ